MGNAIKLERKTFEVSRASEYFDRKELQSQTGQSVQHFASVVVKEETDNALDEAEQTQAPRIEISVWEEKGLLRIAVHDNGLGIAPDTVEKILNFDTRTSDKSAYRSPTRGLQGNAMKTLIGMPYALGTSEPIIIEAKGIRHTISAHLDPGGNVQKSHELSEGATGCEGTMMRVSIPSDGQHLDPSWWASAFALFNPHATIKIRCTGSIVQQIYHANYDQQKTGTFYEVHERLVDFPSPWRKYVATDTTSPHWYSLPALERLVFNHIANWRAGEPGGDKSLRDFVRQFRGLSGSAKTKVVCDQLPQIRYLSDFDQNRALIETLLHLMRDEAKPPPASSLGLVGAAQFRARFERWYGVKRFWYEKDAIEVHGVPYLFEAALAETQSEGQLFTGVNFSPTYSDPFSDTHFATKKISAHGIENFLNHANCSPRMGDSAIRPVHTAVAVHLVSPSLDFLDRGKTHLQVPYEVASRSAEVLFRIARALYHEGEAAKKDAARAERRAYERDRLSDRAEWTQKEAVFEVMAEAYNFATNNGEIPVSVRDLFYAVRTRMQAYTLRELGWGYFGQGLLVEYQQLHGAFPLLYSEARGVLYEPHNGRVIPLGEREVESYDFPHFVYDKILYIEKQGVWRGLKPSGIAEHFDMAVVATQGYATEAIRTLFRNADTVRNYRIFVFHDADPDGYNIARTLQEATARMPNHHIEVTDLGLRLEEALEMGLETEMFNRKKALPSGLRLTEIEKRYFSGKTPRRIEINAIPPAERVAYLERKLREAGATEKVIPPPEILREEYEVLYKKEMASWIDEKVSTLLDLPSIKSSIAEHHRAEIATDPNEWVSSKLTADPLLSWREVAEHEVTSIIEERATAVRSSIREALTDALATLIENPEP